jgi:L-alanine-DL-glutamate epimerase-like enolase superfamily enzyme
VKITAVEPLVLRADRVDTSRADGTQDAFLVRVHTDEGVVGIGEADTSPYLARTMIEMPSSHAVARGVAEVLVGKDPLDADGVWHTLYDATYHYGRAGVALHVMSAIDIALWDIAGKASGRPVHELLGGATVATVPVYASEVMPETPDEVRRLAEAAVAGGYRALKLGWGALGRSLDRVRIGDVHRVLVDAGHGGAGALECVHHSPADAAGGARDEGHPAIEGPELAVQRLEAVAVVAATTRDSLT